jgi:hypothetical protein
LLGNFFIDARLEIALSQPSVTARDVHQALDAFERAKNTKTQIEGATPEMYAVKVAVITMIGSLERSIDGLDLSRSSPQADKTQAITRQRSWQENIETFYTAIASTQV